MSYTLKTSVVLATSTLLSLAPLAPHAATPFAQAELGKAYNLSVNSPVFCGDKDAEGKCGDKKGTEGKCGDGKGTEGKCGDKK